MARAKKAVKVKKQFALSDAAIKLIEKMHDMVVKEVMKFDKQSQKSKAIKA